MTGSATFNIGVLSPYLEDEIGYGHLRVNPFKGGEDDANQSPDQDPQPRNGKSMLTDHLIDQFREERQCSFDVCLRRSLLCFLQANKSHFEASQQP